MRVVIKPAGAIILALAVGAVSFFAFQNGRRANAPTYSALPLPGEDRLATTKWIGSTVLSGVAEFQQRQEAVIGGDGTVPVYKVQIKRVPEHPWDVQWIGRGQVALQKGEHLRLVFQARSSEKCPFNVTCQEAEEPFLGSGGGTISPTGKWTTYTIPFQAIRDYKPDGYQVAFHCGIKTGTIEIADVVLMSNKP